MFIATLFNSTFWVNNILCIRKEKEDHDVWPDKRVAYMTMFPSIVLNILLSSLWFVFMEHLFPLPMVSTLFDIFFRLPCAYVVSEMLYWLVRMRIRIYKPNDLLPAVNPAYLHPIDWFNRVIIPHTISHYVAGTVPTAAILCIVLTTNMFIHIRGPRTIRYTGYILDPVQVLFIKLKYNQLFIKKTELKE